MDKRRSAFYFIWRITHLGGDPQIIATKKVAYAMGFLSDKIIFSEYYEITRSAKLHIGDL